MFQQIELFIKLLRKTSSGEIVLGPSKLNRKVFFISKNKIKSYMFLELFSVILPLPIAVGMGLIAEQKKIFNLPGICNWLIVTGSLCMLLLIVFIIGYRIILGKNIAQRMNESELSPAELIIYRPKFPNGFAKILIDFGLYFSAMFAIGPFGLIMGIICSASYVTIAIYYIYLIQNLSFANWPEPTKQGNEIRASL